jgi:hypothetical protein
MHATAAMLLLHACIAAWQEVQACPLTLCTKLSLYGVVQGETQYEMHAVSLLMSQGLFVWLIV